MKEITIQAILDGLHITPHKISKTCTSYMQGNEPIAISYQHDIHTCRFDLNRYALAYLDSAKFCVIALNKNHTQVRLLCTETYSDALTLCNDMFNCDYNLYAGVYEYIGRSSGYPLIKKVFDLGESKNRIECEKLAHASNLYIRKGV